MKKAATLFLRDSHSKKPYVIILLYSQYYFSIPNYILFICQSISFLFNDFKISLAFEKCLHPKKPLDADKGLGCGAVKIK